MAWGSIKLQPPLGAPPTQRISVFTNPEGPQTLFRKFCHSFIMQAGMTD